MPEVSIDKPAVLDILDTSAAPALSSTSDVPVIETKPDATPAPKQEEAEAVSPEKSEQTEQPGESATPATDEDSGQPAEEKAPRGVGKALAEQRKQIREAERRAEAAEARLDRALAALERAGAGEKPAPVDREATQVDSDPEPVRPSKADFPDPDAFEQALMDYAEQRATWTAKQEVARLQRQTAEEQQAAAIREAQQAAQQAYVARIEKVKADMPDWDEVASSPDVQVSVPMAAAILHSENGPRLQYYLGKNPQEAQRIRELSPPLQLLELGKLEAKLTAAPAPKPVVSAAPAPIKPISGGSPSSTKDPENMSMEEYAAYRRAQLNPSRPARH